jgi:hypothetical protein
MTALAPAAALAALLATAAEGGEGSPRPVAVALVSEVSGEATRATPRGEERLALFDRLEEGESITAGDGAALTVVFADGRRERLEERGRAQVERGGLQALEGSVARLPPVPAFVTLAPLVLSRPHASRAAAARIRAGPGPGPALAGLSPRGGAAVLPERAVLRLDPCPEAVEYRFEVEAEDGRPLFASSSAAPEVRLPPALLAPGSVYFWRVTARGPGGRPAAARALFRAASAAEVLAREGLAEEARAEGSLGALLAEVDRCLGLGPEVCAAAADAGTAAALGCPLRPTP